MFGKGTFKSSGRQSASVNALNRPSLETKISAFSDAEKTAESADGSVKAVQLYSRFLNEADNTDEGKPHYID